VSQPNYPDILGYITGGPRLNVNVVQCALAVRPRVPRAGRPFEAILLIQNVSDQNVDVTATLQLPDKDAQKKPKRFITKSERLVVGVRPAEVGYVILPVASLPDTAVSDQYKIGMAVEVKPLGKPKRIRLPEGGGPVVLEYLSDDALQRIEDLKKLTYSTAKRGLMGTAIEVPFSILSAQVGHLVDLKAGWVSLWKMSDYRDDRLLFERYRDVLSSHILPQLKQREKLYRPLLETTQKRIEASGYALEPIEAHYIAKLMVALLEMANPQEQAFDYRGEEIYDVALLLKKPPPPDRPFVWPSWCRAVLKAVDENPDNADNVAQILATTAFDELLRDAIRHGFKTVSKMTGETLGSDEDMASYGERLIQKLANPEQPLEFTDIYLPLVLGGILFYDRAVLPNEKVGESLKAIHTAVKERASERNEDNELIFVMAERLIDRTLQKYGYRT
jgi:hypothetical protein